MLTPVGDSVVERAGFLTTFGRVSGRGRGVRTKCDDRVGSSRFAGGTTCAIHNFKLRPTPL